MFGKITLPREPLNAFTHFAGIVLSVIGTIYILIDWAVNPNIGLVRPLSALAFAISLIALYSSSTVYHWSNGSADHIKLLRKLDHAMIYVLIAGSYTPMLLTYLPGSRGIIFTSVIWTIAIIGIIIKLKWFNAPRILSTSLYVILGWSILADTTVLTSLPRAGFILLLLGGLSYTIGGIIYAIKKPNISKSFGFHELFHSFVLLGSLFHYFTVVLYVL